LLYYNDVARST